MTFQNSDSRMQKIDLSHSATSNPITHDVESPTSAIRLSPACQLCWCSGQLSADRAGAASATRIYESWTSRPIRPTATQPPRIPSFMTSNNPLLPSACRQRASITIMLSSIITVCHGSALRSHTTPPCPAARSIGWMMDRLALNS